MKGKTLCLLALTALFGQPALANEPQHTPPATDQRTAVLGQPRTGTLHPAPEEKAKKDAQALFEESLRIKKIKHRRYKIRLTVGAPQQSRKSSQKTDLPFTVTHQQHSEHLSVPQLLVP